MTIHHYTLDSDGHAVPCADFLAWCEWMASHGNAIQRTTVDCAPARFVVSTVFLGIDHGVGSGAPILFETMILVDYLVGAADGNQEPLGTLHYQDRYPDRESALVGHAAALAWLHRRLMCDLTHDKGLPYASHDADDGN